MSNFVVNILEYFLCKSGSISLFVLDITTLSESRRLSPVGLRSFRHLSDKGIGKQFGSRKQSGNVGEKHKHLSAPCKGQAEH